MATICASNRPHAEACSGEGALGDAPVYLLHHLSLNLSAQNRSTALQSGEVDVLLRNTGWSLTREATLGLMFAADPPSSSA